MSYRENPQALCDFWKTGTPLPEDKIPVKYICFLTKDGWVRVNATESNRLSRLYFWDRMRDGSESLGTSGFCITTSERDVRELKFDARRFFSEQWDYPQVECDMLPTFKESFAITIRLKMRSDDE